jgi:hypothetical protein
MYDQDAIIKGTLVVDIPYLFNDNSNILLDEGAKIIINDPLAPLGIETTVIRGCAEMWDHIEVSNGAWLSISNSTIEDGIQAILIHGGGKVSIKDNDFKNNGVGLAVVPSNGSSISHIASFAFYGNDFTSNSRLKAPLSQQEKGSAGVLVQDYWSTLDLSGTSSKPNNYSNLHNGIMGFQTGLVVKNSSFADIVEDNNISGIPFSGRAIYIENNNNDRQLRQIGFGGGPSAKKSFGNCTYGVYAVGSNVDVSGNNMANMGTGVEVQKGQLKNIVVRENRIAAAVNGISLYQNTRVKKADILDNVILMDDPENTALQTNATGIRAEEGVGTSAQILFAYKIQDNAIDLANAKNGISLRNASFVGIKENTVEAVGSAIPHLSCLTIEDAPYTRADCNLLTGNTTDGTGYGIHVKMSRHPILRCNSMDNTPFGVAFRSTCLNTALLGNIFNDADEGLLVDYLAQIDEQPYRGNTWVGSYDTAPAYFAAEPNTIPDNQFLIDPNVSNYSNHHPSGIYPSSGWFVDQTPSGQTTYTCGSTCPDGIGSDEEGFAGELENAIANGLLDSSYCLDARIWTAKRQLYAFLMENPSIPQSEQKMQNFLESAALTTIADFYDVEEGIRELFEVDSTVQEAIEDNRVTISANLDQITFIDSLFDVGGMSSQDSIAYTGQRDSLRTDLVSVVELNDSLLYNLADERATAAASVKSANASITTTEDFEDNLQAVYDIYLEAIASNSFEFDSATLAELEYIANQCFICGGDGVFLARSLYSKTEPGLIYDDDDLCYIASQPLKGPAKPKQLETAYSFRISPNPASNWLMGEQTRGEAFEGEMAILDAAGKMVFSTRVSFQDSENVTVDLSTLSTGFYTCNFYNNGKLVQVEKFSLIK